MKRLRKSLMMCLSVGMLLIANPLEAAEFDLTLHHFYAPSEPSHTNVLVPWAREVEKLTNGRVKIVIAPGMSLGGKPKDLTAQVRSGQVDLIWVVNGYSGKKGGITMCS